MLLSEDFLELIAAAQDAIDALLVESRQDAWIDLRAGLRELGQAVRDNERRGELLRVQEELEKLREEQKNATRRRESVSQRRIDLDDAEAAWKRMPRERRETLVLHVLGDDRLVIREITGRMNAELGYPQSEGESRVRALYGSEVTNLVKRLWREGQLEREAETFKVNHTRYRYSRRRGLDGPIADLERAFRDDEAA